ncbi:MAG: glycogen/starch/alpha-glucan phosphorylase [Gammaproteobacteria bacterium]|nr:glycogen/starch/alpha-glucan phosphorylase [Gammaproteobacteria bacterium]MCP5458640.1 glycogen/starch/alpha-glucan phosphorylase [Gammaproteobacteria bacterium]
MSALPISPMPQRSFEDVRTSLTKEGFKRDFLNNLFYLQGKFPALASRNDYYMALAYTVRDRLLQRWISTAAAYTRLGSRTVAYLSAEFLLGPHLGNNLINLGIYPLARQAIRELGLTFEELLAKEEEPGLGNGGLGRLAACFLDSLATLEIPTLGYGIRYEFGIFAQDLIDGWQVERTDKWLRYGNPWELPRPEWAVVVKLGGHVEHGHDETGRSRARWIAEQQVVGVPYDTPILGYQNNTANTLRLWRAEAPESFDLGVFNRGDYYGAVQSKVFSENITKILYPNDEQIQGKELRLEQQYFFVSCSLQDMLRIMRGQEIPLEQFHEKFAVQLNDTHPAVAIAELMRLLVDEEGLDWEKAWSITQKTFAYTNHTLLPEALERWPLGMFGKILPRHLEIIYEINAQFLGEVRTRFPGDDDKVARLSLIDECGERYVRMAHLACVGSHAVNGVAELHSELLKRDVLADFHALSPEKFNNKTNGVTPRRWLALCNPRLTKFISSVIGDGWIKDLSELRRLEPFVEDAGFRREWRFIKRSVKEDFVTYAYRATGIGIDPATLFDVQVKRIHEYKRQHLNVLHIVTLYNRLKSNPNLDLPARTFVFGGKAAPGYHMAKLMIKLITSVGEVINKDPAVRDRLKVVFLPNYNVTNGQRVYPASDLSEQISTAGKEASGTGNMKFSMNGALTIGTLDGANVEIREEVGAENFFLFGLTIEEVNALWAKGYDPMGIYQANAELREALDLIRSGHFSRGDGELFRPLVDSLLYSDPYLLLADYQAYVDCQDRVGQTYCNPELWTRMAILNVARMGKFSSDRSIQEYCDDIWQVESVPVQILTQDEVRDGLLQ